VGLPEEPELLKRIEREIIDGFDEELELEIEDRTHEDILSPEGIKESDLAALIWITA